MNILADRLPEALEVGGKLYPIRTDYRTWIRFEQMTAGGELSAEEIAELLQLVFLPGPLPPTLSETFFALRDFYAGPQQPEEELRPPSGRSERIYDFAYDAPYIYSAFWAQYGIDLQEAPLHWWKFLALFMGLSEETLIVKIMQYRSVKLPEIQDKKMRDFYRKMKKRFAIPHGRDEAQKLNEIEQALLGGGDLTGLLGSPSGKENETTGAGRARQG